MTLESGQVLSARFTLARRLGTGGSGEVWLAQDRELKKLVALKVLAGELARNDAALAALSREYERLRRLAHEYIVQVEGLYRSGDHAWIVMEYLAGGDLSQLRGRGWRDVLRAVLPIATALAHAHEAGIVHRDVKPANVLLGDDGVPRLADFGTALALAVAPEPDGGRGSPFSMSPQQRVGEAATVADDVYGCGAMLYELLCGYPPYYPDDAWARMIHPALGASGAAEYDNSPMFGAGGSAWNPSAHQRVLPALPTSVPRSLAQLVERMLANEPMHRPGSMRSVEQKLKTLLANLPVQVIIDNVNSQPPPRIEPPSAGASAAQGEPLRGEWRRGVAASHGGSHGERAWFRRAGAALVALALLAVALVFVALPRWVAKEPPSVEAATAQKPPAPTVEAPKAAVDFAALARAKQEVDELRVGLEERLGKLVERAAPEWDAQTYARAAAEHEAGEEAYAQREYVSAREHYEALEPLITRLEQHAGEVLDQRLRAGALALDQGLAAQALPAFQMALKIEPGNAAATRGMKRASTLDEVMAMVTAGERLEKDEQTAAALAQFRKALALDAQAPRAADGVRRIEARLAGDAFAAAMARGYAALAANDRAGARVAFEAARVIRPDAPEIAPALGQIEQEQRTAAITAKLEQAQQMETREQWAQALVRYREVLELDSTIAAASEGAARASSRAALNEQLELYLTQPERLFSQSVRASAKQMIERAGAIEHPGPVLKKQIATLQQWLARADVPVPVALQSDNLTRVTIYRVGELGAFDRRSLELLPGSYIVVGTRPGYRDVRREIMVRPGGTPEPVVIRCEDPI